MKYDDYCPKCGAYGHWRNGVGFDHERRCADCGLRWVPGEDAGPMMSKLIKLRNMVLAKHREAATRELRGTR